MGYGSPIVCKLPEGRNYTSKIWSGVKSTGFMVRILNSDYVALANYLTCKILFYYHHHHHLPPPPHFWHSDHCFSNCHMHMDFLGSGVGLRPCVSNGLPGNVDDACLLVTLREARSQSESYVRYYMWNSKTLPISLLNLKSSLSLIFYPYFKFISKSHWCCNGSHPECSQSWPPLSLPTSAKPPSHLSPGDYCSSFLTGLLASIPVLFPPCSESLWYSLHPEAMWSFYSTN